MLLKSGKSHTQKSRDSKINRKKELEEINNESMSGVT